MLRLKALHHVHVQVADLAENERFATAFGFHEAGREEAKIYFRTSGNDAYSYVAQPGEQTQLCSIAFAVESYEDLESAVRERGATPVRPLTGPGGGEAVSLTDPEGNIIDLVYGIKERQPDAMRRPMAHNHPLARMRFNEAHDYPAMGPSTLLRLGHIGLFIKDFKRCDEWYRNVLGLVASDQLHIGGAQYVGGFYRINRGAEWVDHHAIAFFAFGKSEVHHMSFEVPDSEHQFIAHRHMQKGGWEPVWGVGRHPLGSHVFDVWKDPNGLRFETFTDTDVCNNDRPMGIHAIEASEMDVWSNDPATKYFA
ncbi:VOC family protein [Azohydromonas australica]|uniref:VOC family protein n=1 Tax=Azohydromonas australica TaxID=364039 RepID=UPI0003F72D44|nr:VOC family protein [Azohydromonas australica]